MASAHRFTEPREYRGWPISYDPPPIPYRGADWQATHPDFDGYGDNRYVSSGTLTGLQGEIDAWLWENGPEGECERLQEEAEYRADIHRLNRGGLSHGC